MHSALIGFDLHFRMSEVHLPEPDEEEEDSSDEEDVDLELIQKKFSSLATALQETNQNLVTFEMLQDHYRTVSKAPQASEGTSQGTGENDMLDLLKDICGSVSELKTEIGNSGHTSRINLEEMESKLKYPQKFAELSEKSSKLEVECGFYRNQCQTLDEKYMDEKRKNNHLSDLLQEREGEIRQLNLYLKEAESFSKSVEQENRFLQKQLAENKSKLEQEVESKEQVKSDLETYKERVKKLEDKETIQLSKNIPVDKLQERAPASEAPAEQGGHSDSEPEPEAEGQGLSARSTLSSKSADGGYEEKYRQLKESRNRLKTKTKLLLKQYRGKRSQLERRERQLASQRSGLVKLQTLHQSVESNHCIVIHHLGQQLQQIAGLVGTLWPGDDLGVLAAGAEPGDKLSEWIVRIDSLSAWTISKLVKVSMGRREAPREAPREAGLERSSLRAAALQCEEGIVDEGRAVQTLMLGLEESEDTDRQVNTWM